MDGTPRSPSAEQLLALASQGWWFHHVDVVGRLIDLGRPDLAIDAYRRLSDRWQEDPRGEEYMTRVGLVDDLVRLHPDPAVVEELHRLLTAGDGHVARRAMHHLIRLGVVPAGAGTAAHVPTQRRDDIAPVLHELGLTDAARQHLAASGGPADQQRWWYASYADVAALDHDGLRQLAATHGEWFVRSWAARALLAQGHVEEGLSAYAGLFPYSPVRARDAAAAAEPRQAVAAVAAHLDHPGAQAVMLAAACTEYIPIRSQAVEALVDARTALDVPTCIATLAGRGPGGRLAALALAARTGHDDEAGQLLHAVLADVGTTRSSVAASTLLSLQLPDLAAEAAAALVSGRDPQTPTAHVGAALKVLWQVGGPRSLELIRLVAKGGRRVPRPWRDYYLRKQARHYQKLLEG